jgi:hypothetical protein
MTYAAAGVSCRVSVEVPADEEEEEAEEEEDEAARPSGRTGSNGVSSFAGEEEFDLKDGAPRAPR